jgi:hypothetical protein
VVAARDVGRGNFAGGIDAAVRSRALGAVIIQRAAMARALCAARHGTLADVLRSARRREQGMGEKRGRSLVVFFSRKNFDHNDEPSVTHSYDCGAAWENFALQGFQEGLVVHGMQGFDYDRARKELRIPDDFQVEAMAAVGRPGPKELLPEKYQARETPNDRRKLSESVFEGPFKSK